MKNMPFDLETGGLVSSKHSILTAYFCIVDDNWNIVDELDLKLKPDSGVPVYDEEALEVNGIDIEQHLADPETVTYSEGKARMEAFFRKHHTGGRWPTLRPCGHNIGFDLNFLTDQLGLDEDVRKKLGVHYQILDTNPIVQYKKVLGVYPDKVGRLGDIADFLGVPKGPAHTAKGDVVTFNNVIREMIKRDRSALQGGGATNTTSDELLILEL